MTNARLRLQQLKRQADQTLVGAHLASLRSSAAAFAPSDVETLFAQLRVPTPANVHTVLARMRERELVVQLGSGQWALTPLGEQAVAEIAITWSAADYQTEFVADFAGTQHHTIGAELAPVLLAEPSGGSLRLTPSSGTSSGSAATLGRHIPTTL